MTRAALTGLLVLAFTLLTAEGAQAGVWQPAQRVSSPGDRVRASAIAANDRGESVLAYVVASDQPQGARVRRRTERGRLGRVQVLRTSPFWQTWTLAAAIDARGRAIVAWAETLRSPTATATRITAAHAAPGRPFGRPQVVARAGSDGVFALEAALRPEDAVLAWTTNAAANVAVESSDGDWQAQELGTGTGAALALAAGRDGGVEVAWPGDRLDNELEPNVSLARLVPGAERFAPARAVRRGGEAFSQLRLVRTRACETVVASVGAIENSSIGDRFFGPLSVRVLSAGGAQGRLARLDRFDRRSTTRGAEAPTLASAGGGTIVAWQRVLHPPDVSHPLTGSMVARWRPDRGRFKRTIRLSRRGWVALRPSAAVTAAGRAAVAWEERRFDDLSRRARVALAMRAPDGSWDRPWVLRGSRARAPELVAAGERLLLTRLRARSILEVVEGRP